MNTPPVDLTKSNKDYSIFLPSISGFYTKTMANKTVRTPPGFEHGIDGLDFLKSTSSYFSYKWGLYSAGHACLDPAKRDDVEPMIQKRDKTKSFILGDSGGFQIMTGVLKCDWATFKTDDTLREKILNWLEHTADYSMVLDVPTLAITPTYSEKTGLTTLDECLDYTKFNNDWMLKHRTFNTKFLNSMQGRSLDEALYWYDNTKHYAFEGFGFGGSTTRNLTILLNLILRMREDKLLEKGERDYLHFLGMSRPEWAVYFTAIKRVLRDTVNSDMEVSYDAASAFISATKGQMTTFPTLSNKRFGFVLGDAIDDRHLTNKKLPLPWKSPIFDRMTTADLCVRDKGIVNTQKLIELGLSEEDLYDSKEHLNNPELWDTMATAGKHGNVTKTSWDISSYLFVMAHNVYQTIETLQSANGLTDIALATNELDYNDIIDVSAQKMKLDVSPYAPTDILMTIKIIEDVLTSETPYTVLDKVNGYLNRSVVLKTAPNTDKAFGSLFT